MRKLKKKIEKQCNTTQKNNIERCNDLYINEDEDYFNMLQEIRCGKPSFDTISNLVLCSKKKFIESDHLESKPTFIYPIKRMVDKVNLDEMSKLKKDKGIETQEVMDKEGKDN